MGLREVHKKTSSLGVAKITIAISLIVNDGVVLASDSAASFQERDPKTKRIGIINIYEKGNKVFNLRKGLPIGAVSWGVGGIGQSSIETLSKDFRKLISEEEPLDPENYTIENVAKQYSDFLESKYNNAFGEWSDKPGLGIIIVGYSAKKDYAEEWSVEFKEGTGECSGPQKIREPHEAGITWKGDGDIITRIYFGFSLYTPNLLRNFDFLDEERIKQIVDYLKQNQQAQLVIPAMPIQDAIGLAEFLVDSVIKYSKYRLGPPTVGGPIEIAAITKHGGFKWVKRKHYFPKELNPNDEEGID